MSKANCSDIDVVILCGGLGTRLSGIVNDRPKPMAEINGQPFLDLLIDYISRFGFCRFVLCAGFKSGFIADYYWQRKQNIECVISTETQPLGTAGAIKNAAHLIKTETFLVLNGDSFCPINMKAFLEFHHRYESPLSIALTTTENSMDYGLVRLEQGQKIVGFNEKAGLNSSGVINAGMYLFNKEILNDISPNQKLSLEYDIFPQIIKRGIYGFVTRETLLDIGTPERLQITRDFFKNLPSYKGDSNEPGKIRFTVD